MGLFLFRQKLTSTEGASRIVQRDGLDITGGAVAGDAILATWST